MYACSVPGLWGDVHQLCSILSHYSFSTAHLMADRNLGTGDVSTDETAKVFQRPNTEPNTIPT